MTTKRKSKGKSPSVFSFLLLLILIIGGTHAVKNYPKLLDMQPDEVKEIIDEQLRPTASKEKTPAQQETAGGIGSFSKDIEIPLALKTKNEIRLNRIGYRASYNPFYKTPNWVAWELTAHETEGSNKRTNKFVADPDLPEPKVTTQDYTHSGYDRGHMAPAADMKWNSKAMAESFYMSNICPQNPKLNKDDWADLEEKCRSWAKKYGKVYIVCGPVYTTAKPKCIGLRKVAVPDHFYKVVLLHDGKQTKAMGFLFKNKSGRQSLEKYMVTVDSLEKLTGYDFFSKLPDRIENEIEAVIPKLP